jgi:glycosyltransferase 2 family protein
MSNVSTVASALRRNVSKRKWVSFPFRITITLLLLVFLFKSLSWSTLFAALTHTSYVFLLLGLLIGVVASLISAFQWQILLRAEQISVGIMKLCKLYLIGIGFSHFLPTGMGGDVVKAFYVGRASGNYASSASAIVMTRLTGYFGMQLVAFSALLLFHNGITRSVVVWAILLSLFVGSMIGGVLLLTILLPKILNRSWTTYRIVASAIPVGEALIATIQRPRLLGSVTSVGVVFWVLSVLDYYMYANALHMHVPLSFFFVAIPIISLVAFLPITINGFGLRESAFVYIFASVHVPTATSLLLALLMDVQVLLFGMIGGCLYLTMSSEERNIKKQRETEESDDLRSIADRNAAITWCTKEDQDVFDTRILAFDDSSPTLPMMLLSSKPKSMQGERVGPGSQDATRPPRRQGQQRFAASLTPVLQESRPRAVMGKNRRVVLVKDEDER